MSSSKTLAFERKIALPAPPFSDTYDVRRWEMDFLRTREFLRGREFGISDQAKTVRYPVRMLRYWFTWHLLAAEYGRLARPIDVIELGTHNGQMRKFTLFANDRTRRRMRAPRYNRWLGVDAVPKYKILQRNGYHHVLKADIESSDLTLPGSFDVAICLHILEHTANPEAALRKIAAALRPGGSVIGGSPVLPHCLVRLRERQLRRTAQPLGHVTAFSPKRVRELVTAAGLTIEFISGAYFMRHKGFVCENSRSWLKFNVRWGRTFPWWPGEIHWLARKAG